jgi:hypothetical protein
MIKGLYVTTFENSRKDDFCRGSYLEIQIQQLEAN